MMGRSLPNELIQQAARTDLVVYCNTHGIELVKSGDEYVMKDHDSFNISAKEPWKWYWFSEGVGGKAVDFIMYWYGVDLQEAVEELIGVVPTDMRTQLPTHIKNQKIVSTQRRVIAYLCSTRHLDYDIVCEFLKEGKLMEDSYGNCVFPICDDTGTIISAELHGTVTISGKPTYKNTVTVTNSYGFEYKIGDAVEWVLYTESAIDLMSLYQLYKDKLNSTLLVSIAGLKPTIVEHYKAMYPNAKHCLCVDHDDSGIRFVQKAKKIYTDLSCRFPDEGVKDWNDLLNLRWQAQQSNNSK